MKRSNQLILESALIASLILGLTLGGTIGGLGFPSAWESLPNPVNIQTQFNYANFALLYNTTLTQLADQNFTGVSYVLNQFSFLNYPTKLNTTVAAANTEITGMNTAIPLAFDDLNLAQNLIASGQIINASSNLKIACSLVDDASFNDTQFTGTTTPEFSGFGVPVSLYSSASGLVNASIVALSNRCQLLAGELNGLANFTISSPQKTLETGGYMQIQGNLKVASVALINNSISFYLNGTEFATAKTDQNGFFSINSSTSFAYGSTAAIWGVAAQVPSLNFGGAVSNTLFLKLVYNQTQIVVQDPPAVLPTFNFTVTGQLSTTSGRPLPNAPVKITSFGSSHLVKTNTSGFFSDSLTVPSNATDGLYTIYASFAPEGIFGPSVNFTTIEVIHERLTVTINPSSLAYSGLDKKISGMVTTNGTAVSFANVTIKTQWGSFFAQTNARGQFNASIMIPISEFGLSSKINAFAIPMQPYIGRSSSFVSISILNPLDIAFPVILGGVLVYELRSLNVFRRRSADRDEQEVNQTVQNLFSQANVPESKVVSKLVEIYKSALLLGVRKYNLRFLPSSTIREIISQVNSSAHDIGNSEFSMISLLLEDFLYAESFDEKRINDAEEALNNLEKIWGV